MAVTAAFPRRLAKGALFGVSTCTRQALGDSKSSVSKAARLREGEQGGGGEVRASG